MTLGSYLDDIVVIFKSNYRIPQCESIQAEVFFPHSIWVFEGMCSVVLSFSIEAGCHEWEFADPTSDIWDLQSATEDGPALAPKSGGKSLTEKTKQLFLKRENITITMTTISLAEMGNCQL